MNEMYFYTTNAKLCIWLNSGMTKNHHLDILRAANNNNAQGGNGTRYVDVPVSCVEKLYPDWSYLDWEARRCDINLQDRLQRLISK